MVTENTKYVDYFRNEEFLSKYKEVWEEKLAPQVKNIDYLLIAHAIPDKKNKEDLEKQFYVEFKLSYGKMHYKIVNDSKPKKPKIGWIWRGTPKIWKLTSELGDFSKLKKVVSISQFQRINMDAIFQLNALFFGNLVGLAKVEGIIEGYPPSNDSQKGIQPNQTVNKEPRRSPEELEQEFQILTSKINQEGWNPILGRQLGKCYFEQGNLEKAEEEYFKYLSQTYKNDVPALIYIKWISENFDKMELRTSKGGNTGETLFSMTPEELKQLYETAKINYLKSFSD